MSSQITVSDSRINLIRFKRQRLLNISENTDLLGLLESIPSLPIFAGNSWLALMARSSQINKSWRIEQAKTMNLLCIEGIRFIISLIPRSQFQLIIPCRADYPDHILRGVEKLGISTKGLTDLEYEITGILKKGPKSLNEIRHSIPEFKYIPWRTGAFARIVIPPSNLDFVLYRMQRRGLLIQIRDFTKLYDPTPRYAFAEQFGLGQKFTDKQTAREWLAKRYLHWYGPASVYDFTWYIDCRLSDTKRLFDKLSLTQIVIKDHSDEPKYILESDIDDFIGPEPEHSDELILLPMHDPLITGFRDKGGGFLKQPNLIQTRSGHLKPLVVRTGRILGTWELDINTLRATPHWFDAPSQKDSSDFELQASKLSEFLSGFPDKPIRIPEVFTSNN